MSILEITAVTVNLPCAGHWYGRLVLGFKVGGKPYTHEGPYQRLRSLIISCTTPDPFIFCFTLKTSVG